MNAIEVTMTETEASQTTARIKLLLATITESMEKVIRLVEKAEAGRAWEVLGYASWTETWAGGVYRPDPDLPAQLEAEFWDWISSAA